jgi:hypothetical protein
MKTQTTTLTVVLATALSSTFALGDPPKDGIDSEGYLCTWLVVSPIPFKDGAGGGESLAEEQVKGEATLKPKVGDKIEVGGKSLAWKECQAKDQALDFNDLLGHETENSVGYAVAYLVADADLDGVTLKIGSDDQAKVYWNGKVIYTQDEPRPFEKDEDSVSDLTLKRGLNVLVVKVVNEQEDWQLSARLLDKDGKPITNLKMTTKPE